MTATIDLLKLQAVFGVFLFEDANKLQYFSFISDGSNVIGCPDGMNAFEQIEVIEQLVICKTLEGTYRIYIRNQKEWLADIIGSNNFYGQRPVVTINNDFIQANSADSPNEGWPIYLLKEKRWIPSPLSHRNTKDGFFKTKIKQITFHDKKALQLEYGEGYLRYSLYMIYFIEENMFFTIPTPEHFHTTIEDSKNTNMFRFVSETYAIFYYERSNTFELYDVREKKFLKISEFVDVKTSTSDQKSHMDSAYKVVDIVFNENNLALKIRRGISYESITEWYVFEFKKNLQQVTETFTPVPVARSYFDNVTIDESGKMKISFTTKQNLINTL
jgi:hypothetical protein